MGMSGEFLMLFATQRTKRSLGRLVMTLMSLGAAVWPASARGELVATTQEVIESKLDLWGEAAIKQPDGPSYEFFEKLLPPLRYVDTDYHHSPILLSAGVATIKA